VEAMARKPHVIRKGDPRLPDEMKRYVEKNWTAAYSEGFTAKEADRRNKRVSRSEKLQF
jgi:hypothetical protein